MSERKGGRKREKIRESECVSVCVIEKMREKIRESEYVSLGV